MTNFEKEEDARWGYLEIPTFIRNRDRETLADEAARKEMEAGLDSLGMAIENDEEEL